MERKRTFTMNLDGIANDDNDDDDRFFETFERISRAMPFDLPSSDEEDEDYEDSRMSFASTVSSVHHHHSNNKEFQNLGTSTAGSMSPDFNIWMVAPGSITERRKCLLQDMGLSRDKELLSFSHAVPVKIENNHQVSPETPRTAKYQ